MLESAGQLCKHYIINANRYNTACNRNRIAWECGFMITGSVDHVPNMGQGMPKRALGCKRVFRKTTSFIKKYFCLRTKVARGESSA